MKTNYLPALTGVRFVAASAVFFCHYPALLASKTESPFFFYFLRQLNVGVNVFFVLSGFLITYSYYQLPLSGRNISAYFLKRFARIYPLYFLLLLLHYAMLYRQREVVAPVFEVFLNLSLIKGLSGQYYLSGIAQSWSLAVEEMFYAAAPVLLLLIRAKKPILHQVVALLAIGLALTLVFHFFPFEGFFSSLSFLFSATFPGRCFEFGCGIYLAMLVMKRRPGTTASVHYTAAGAIIFGGLLLLQTGYAVAFEVEAVNKTLFGIVFSNFAFPIAISFFFYGLITEKSWLQKALASRLVVLLGKSSYAFYLVHLGFVAEAVYFHLSSHWLWLYLCLQMISLVLYKAFEQPVHSFLLKIFSPSRQPEMQTGVSMAQ